MNWRGIEKSDFARFISREELDELKKHAEFDSEIVHRYADAVIQTCRSSLATAGSLTGPENTIPGELIPTAMAVLCYWLLTRFSVRITPERRKAYDEAMWKIESIERSAIQ